MLLRVLILLLHFSFIHFMNELEKLKHIIKSSMARIAFASVKFQGDGAMILFQLLLLLQLALLFLLLLLSNYFTVAAASGEDHVGNCMEKERNALLNLKAGLVADDSSFLPSWDSDDLNSDCCQWERVICNNQTGHIEVLDLNGGDEELGMLRGEIRASLTELQHLRYLNLSLNWFADSPVPEFLGSLRNLRFLDLQASLFNGRIPNGLAGLSHLQYLDLSGNNLEGTIPHQLGNLSRLQYLDLRGIGLVGLVGTIPHQLGRLSNLQELYLGFNPGLELNDEGLQWLSNLTLLTHLDLGRVNYSHGSLHTIGKLSKLQQLMLYGCDLSDLHLISLSPSMLNFSTSLNVLDLSGNAFTSSKIFQWVFNATSNLTDLDLSRNQFEGPIQYDFGKVRNPLQRLDLSFNQLLGEVLESLTNVCTLHSLSLKSINLNYDISTILLNMSGCARYSLRELSLRDNQITGTLPDLSIFPSLSTLDLSYNRLSGKLQEAHKLPPKLESFNVESNSLEGGIPKSFGNICTLSSLSLFNNNLSEELSIIIDHLSDGCAKYSLQELILASNKITGTIPNMSMFRSLETLDLSHNLLNGKIPENIQFPYQLKWFYMRFNNLEGVITDSHFANTSMLKVIDLGYNSLALIFSENWVPSFQVYSIYLSSSRLGPNFPKWLNTQIHLYNLDISNVGISDVVPMWFWVQATKLSFMNISYNNLTGIIPDLPMRFSFEPCQVILDSNQFEGSIPPFLRSAASLHLFQNKFSEARSLLCSNSSAEKLGVLDLSKNSLSGQLPDCWSHFKELEFLDLSNNAMSGEVPSSLGSLLQLKVLILRNNNFTGKLPFSLMNCKKLIMLDLGENRLSGSIPSWIGIGQQLQMLSLRKNQFTGGLPQNLCYLINLQLLDLSINNLSGQILKCLKNFTRMSQNGFSNRTLTTNYYYVKGGTYGIIEDYDLIALLMWKGSEQLFKNNKLILNSIDLSSNQLTGNIPEEIGYLGELVSLNLSKNSLTGEITSEIGRLKSLDFLDLSQNHFFGSIPASLAQVDRLSVLNLSYNNLSGRIPISTQLQSFNASSFEGNADLCGKPLEKKCPGDEEEQQDLKRVVKNSSSEDKKAVYWSVALGFITGFWGFLGSLLFNRTWRHTYILFLNNIIDRVYFITVVNAAKFQRKLKGLLEKFGKASPGA